MKICVRLFAGARELAKGPEIRVEVPEGATVADLKKHLARQCPALAGLLERSILAIDEEFTGNEVAIPREADIALLPPVSGG
jgi:molybdopterin converting factor subunit 1